MSANGDRMNELAQRFVTFSTGTPSDVQNDSDKAHAMRLLNDEFARLAVAGTVGNAGGGLSAISSGSTLVSLKLNPDSNQLCSTYNWVGGGP
jgi:hypothetical protein